MKLYSLKKCKQLLRHTYHLFQKQKRTLPSPSRASLQAALIELQQAILEKRRPEASEAAKEVEKQSSGILKKSRFAQVKDSVFALAFALVVAILVRQMWFEFYEIPSGSMRPTLKEQDRLAVSKTAFGVNVPLMLKEFYFDPALVKRGNIVIFTGEDMDIRDVDTLYFYLFPGKKQYVKRMIGKPGDLLYFYGGRIYGLDKEGHDISSEWQQERLQLIDHIPFIDFERKVVMPPQAVGGVYSPLFLYQMNQPVAKLSVLATKRVVGEMLPLEGIHDPSAPRVESYGELWGFGNFAMARLLKKELAPSALQGEAPYYLELRHNPNLSQSKLIQDGWGRWRPTLGLSTSLIPVDEEHIKTLMAEMYTARFVVKGGRAHRFGASASDSNAFLPSLPGVPDGCYEFERGVAYEVVWQGITKELPSSHPLYNLENVSLLFNMGMEWDTRASPEMKYDHIFPARYAYFREGDLFVMGAPLFKKDEGALGAFVGQEKARAGASSSYRGFVDGGPPLNADGSLNGDLIRQRGLLVPEGMYLVLGDNHAMSADSREFGFVPQANLRGAPDLIFWPPGKRWGLPNQTPYPFFNLPRSVVWLLAALCIGGGTLYWRRRNALPLKFEDKTP